MSDTRKLHQITQDIWDNWPRPYLGAVPYLDAMGGLNTVHDYYGADTGDSIVRYFLANASTWRGDAARRIKAELKSLL